VALKVLPAEFAAVPELRDRFLRETRLAAGFSHPDIVPVFAVEEHADVLAFAMGFEEGESLTARVTREGPLAPREAVRLLQDVAYALAYAHGRGVVHRDIKPDNIMIERATGRALVMDFGIARTITAVPEQAGLTRVGEILGTPEFMSPEQATGDVVDGRSDLYALGLVAWFALTGRTVFTGESTQRILVRQLTEAVPPLDTVRPDLPGALAAVVDQCCAKEPADRFAAALTWVKTLSTVQELRRLGRSGFTVDEVQRLLAAVQAERDAVRAQRRLDPQIAGRRRRRVWVASSLLALQFATIGAVLQRARIIDGDANLTGRLEVLVFFAAVLGAALAAAVLASSPFRRPLPEQLFGVTWLSRVGRAVLAPVM
jgi:serine/threonine protein kinase